MQQISSELPANALGLALTAGVCLLFLVLPRRWAIAPVIVMCCYMTTEQALTLAGFHFTMIRLLIGAGWLRVLLRGELRGLVWNRMDRMICGWVVVDVIAYVALWHDSDAVIYKLGFIYNVLGAYFLFRILLQDISDVLRVCKTLALFTIPLAILMLLEKSTGNNLFSIFGGVSSVTAVRDGVLRCQGPFAHPILAGTFGATIFPLVAVLWLDGAIGKLIAICGMASALTIAFTSGSSGPIMALLSGATSLALWHMRSQMSLLRRGIVASLICLQVFMKVPVWFILARVDIFSGSTGFHRAMLIDGALRNLDSWWLMGTTSTLSWASEDQGLFDVTNQYLQVGAEGGVVAMLIFIWIIVTAFSMVGHTWRALEDLDEPFLGQIIVWGLGAALLAHVVSYISVSYFDQNLVNWYLLLAMIATVWSEFSLAPDTNEIILSASVEKEEGVLVGACPATWLKSLSSLDPALQR